MAGTREIIAEMLSVAPPGQRDLDLKTRDALLDLTGLLLEADDSATQEYQRYIDLRHRQLDLSAINDDLRAAYEGRRILVTGGTGCIGQALIRQLDLCPPALVVSLSLRQHEPHVPHPDVVYLSADITNASDVMDAFEATQPDVVFHLAAQRSPWLAEREVEETVMTNVIGTRNVLRACREFEVATFVHAPTGTAMRYTTTAISAASKMVAEWWVQEYAAEGRLTGAARFTHVVDNGVILTKLQEAMDDPRGVARVHDPDIQFYVQSAVESAQLLLLAGLTEQPDRLRMVAIRCLGDPARLLSMTLGKIGRSSVFPPVYFAGYDKGYERGNPPGLYDPLTAADLSPLINAVEAQSAGALAGAPAVDSFNLSLPVVGQAEELADQLQRECLTGTPTSVAAELARAGRVLAQAMFEQCPQDLLTRLDRLAQRAGVALPYSRDPAPSPVR